MSFAAGFSWGVEMNNDIIARRDIAKDFEFLGIHALLAKKTNPAGE